MKVLQSLSVILLLSITSASYAQIMQKPSPYEISTLPLWAQKMYADEPNVFEVDTLYSAYYREHSFEKSFHTQYYKRWRRSVTDYINEQGYVQMPSPERALEIDNEYHGRAALKLPSSWSVLGPIQVLNNTGVPGKRQSNVYSIDQCLADTNIMYCGTEPGEVYKSVDAGNTWVSVSMEENYGSGVTAIEVDPNNGDIVFAGGNNGVFRSQDGAITWSKVLPQSNLGVNEILVNPVNPQLVLAATNKGLYRSVDGGDNWLQLYNQRSSDIKCNSADPSIIYLIKNNPILLVPEFFISTDTGATWIQQTNGWYTSTDTARIDRGGRIAVSPADPDKVYAYLIGDSKANDYGYVGVFRSDDGGYTWTLPNGPVGGPYTPSHPNLAYGNPGWTYHQGFYNCAIVASESNANEILIGGLNLWRSNDGGSTFSSVAGYIAGPLDMHVDNQDFRIINGVCWITTDGGIYRSSDFYNSQPEFRMYGVHASDHWGFGSGWNEDVLVGGLYHNGDIAYHENYGSGNYLELGGGEAPTGYVNPGQNTKTYFSDIGGKYLPSTITGAISGFSIGLSPNQSYGAAESSEMEFHPHCYNIAYIGNENKLWKTTDGGASFNMIKDFGTNVNDKVMYIEVSSSDSDVIYLNQQPASGSTGLLWKSTDGGVNWASLTLPAGNSRKTLLTIDPLDENTLWIAYPNGANGFKVYKTTDGGTTWVNLTTTTLNSEQPHSLVHIAGTDGGVYFCTNRTVYYRNNTMNDWQLESSGLPLYINTNIAKPFYRDSKLRIASYGKGIWESEFAELPSAPIARINVDNLSQTVICVVDSFYFEDHSFLDHTNASWSWSFPTGSPSISSLRNPAVMFSAAGTHMATLTITDGNGLQDFDTINVEVIYYNIPTILAEGFEGNFVPDGWEIYNEDANGQWSTHNVGGYSMSLRSAQFDNYNIHSVGTYDDLRAYVNTVGVSAPKLYFDVAYAAYGGVYSDTLEILVSDDCGSTFTSVYKKGGATLATAPNIQSIFVPAFDEWRTDTVSLSAFSGISNLMVAFRNIGHYGNALYIDNVNIGNLSSALNEADAVNELSVYPNPIMQGECLNIVLPQNDYGLTITDLNGKIIFTKEIKGASAVELPEHLASGTYILSVKGNTKIWNRILVIQ